MIHRYEEKDAKNGQEDHFSDYSEYCDFIHIHNDSGLFSFWVLNCVS